MDNLIEKDILVEHITAQHEIYGMTTEELIKYVKDTEELDRDRYGDCWNCCDYIDCSGCERRERENKELRAEIKKLKKLVGDK